MHWTSRPPSVLSDIAAEDDAAAAGIRAMLIDREHGRAKSRVLLTSML
jgi:hypothetical protein